MQAVVVDANVLVSFFVDRDAVQSDAAERLLMSAEAGDIAAAIPQCIVFELAYVLQTQYGIGGERLMNAIADVIAFPGVRIVDDCPWERVLQSWPHPFSSIADAAVVAVAVANRFDSVATFDRKLAHRLGDFGLTPYF